MNCRPCATDYRSGTCRHSSLFFVSSLSTPPHLVRLSNHLKANSPVTCLDMLTYLDAATAATIPLQKCDVEATFCIGEGPD